MTNQRRKRGKSLITRYLQHLTVDVVPPRPQLPVAAGHLGATLFSENIKGRKNSCGGISYFTELGSILHLIKGPPRCPDKIFKTTVLSPNF